MGWSGGLPHHVVAHPPEQRRGEEEGEHLARESGHPLFLLLSHGMAAVVTTGALA